MDCRSWWRWIVYKIYSQNQIFKHNLLKPICHSVALDLETYLKI